MSVLGGGRQEGGDLPSRTGVGGVGGDVSMCPALIHTANGQVPTRRGKRGFVKTTRKKLAHKSNPVTVTFEGDPIFF